MLKIYILIPYEDTYCLLAETEEQALERVKEEIDPEFNGEWLGIIDIEDDKEIRDFYM